MEKKYRFVLKEEEKIERLTERTSCGVPNLTYPQSCYFKDGTKDQVAVSAYRQLAIERLATYEDTGLEPEKIKEFAEDVSYQFGYYFPIKDMLYISTGGLSTLERAFDILGWNDPHPVPECECEVPGCHEYANCGTPTKDGYKRVCGKHFAELTHEEAEASLEGGGDG